MGKDDDLNRELLEVFRRELVSRIKSVEDDSRTSRDECAVRDESISNKVDVVKDTTNKKFDALSNLICGSVDKVGIAERLRRHAWHLKGLWILILLLIGFKFSGVGLDDVKKMFYKSETEIKQVAESLDTTEVQINSDINNLGEE
jgi:hypothetical protein